MTRATRASTRNAASPDSSQKTSGESPNLKRKASNAGSPPSKRKAQKNEGEKEQKTLEQTMPDLEHENPEDEDINDADMKDAADKVEAEQAKKTNGHIDAQEKNNDADEEINGEKSKHEIEPQTNGNTSKPDEGNADAKEAGHTEKQATENGETSKMDYTGEVSKTSEDNSKSAAITNGDGAVESSQSRGEAMPSSILEKGVIYFFIRPRVGMDQSETSGVQDVARSYIVLRPLPANAKLTDGPIDDLKNGRLLALPKKVLPRSHQDKFMVFVEKAGASIEELKEEFLQGSTYETQTTGVRHSPPVTPVGEGVYAITTTGRESHLAYMLTIPAEMGSVQEEIGLFNKGSFVLSLKNPDQKGPANASLPQGPEFSKEIMDEFRGLRWMPAQPKHFDYANAQFLLIGEGHGDVGKALQTADKDENNDKLNTPNEEMEKLESEDEHRVEGLRGDDTVFDDLGISSKDYPKVATTW